MCEKCGCMNPEKQKDDPEECALEPIAECHPESKAHPCEGKKEEANLDA